MHGHDRDPVADLDPARLADLLCAARSGCRRSFEEIIRRCEPHVRVQARRHAWRHEHIDDIMQDVWFQLLRNAHEIREPRSLLAWLSAVTRHAAIGAGRREARLVLRDVEDTASSPSCTEDEVLQRWGDREVTDGVGRALDRLNEADRTLLRLLHREQRPGYEAIGRQVGRPVGSLGPTRARLLRRLRSDRDISRLAAMVSPA